MNLYNVCFVADKLFSRLNRKSSYFSFSYLWLWQKKVCFILRHLSNLQHFEIVRDYLNALYSSIYSCLNDRTLSDLYKYYSGITGRYSLRKNELINVIIMKYYMS